MNKNGATIVIGKNSLGIQKERRTIQQSKFVTMDGRDFFIPEKEKDVFTIIPLQEYSSVWFFSAMAKIFGPEGSIFYARLKDKKVPMLVSTLCKPSVDHVPKEQGGLKKVNECVSITIERDEDAANCGAEELDYLISKIEMHAHSEGLLCDVSYF